MCSAGCRLIYRLLYLFLFICWIGVICCAQEYIFSIVYSVVVQEETGQSPEETTTSNGTVANIVIQEETGQCLGETKANYRTVASNVVMRKPGSAKRKSRTVTGPGSGQRKPRPITG